MARSATARNVTAHRRAGFAPAVAVTLESRMAEAEARIEALLAAGDIDAAASLADELEAAILADFS